MLQHRAGLFDLNHLSVELRMGGVTIVQRFRVGASEIQHLGNDAIRSMMWF